MSYKNILDQLESNRAMLFLGAGSTRACRRTDGKQGLTGSELANEILKELNSGIEPEIKYIDLTQACELYTSNAPAARSGLDTFIKARLSDLQPTMGHYLATSFPWRAIVTTNYNRVAEDAWGAAHGMGYAAHEVLAIRTDNDLRQSADETKQVRLYKPHGCISTPHQKQNRMILTSLDYYESENLRKGIYDEIRALARQCSIVFVGYSLIDYTFRNIFYALHQQLGQWAARSYSIGPIENSAYQGWLARSMDENFKTTIINETFDSFMLRLSLARGKINKRLKAEVLELWTEEFGREPHMHGISKRNFRELSEM